MAAETKGDDEGDTPALDANAGDGDAAGSAIDGEAGVRATVAATAAVASDGDMAELGGLLKGLLDDEFDPLVEEDAAAVAARTRRNAGRGRGGVSFTLMSEVEGAAGQVLDFPLCDVLSAGTAFHVHISADKDDEEAVGLAYVRSEEVVTKEGYGYTKQFLQRLLLREHRSLPYKLSMVSPVNHKAAPATALVWNQGRGMVTWTDAKNGALNGVSATRSLKASSGMPVPAVAMLSAGRASAVTVCPDGLRLWKQDEPDGAAPLLVPSPASHRFTAVCSRELSSTWAFAVSTIGAKSGSLWKVDLAAAGRSGASAGAGAVGGAGAGATSGSAAGAGAGDSDAKVLTRLHGGMELPTSVACTPDGHVLFVTDPHARNLVRFTVDTEGRLTDDPCVFVDVDEREGAPSAVAVDSNGNPWVAMMYSGQVIRYKAADATVMARITLPAPVPVSLCFGGPVLNELYVGVGNSVVEYASLLVGDGSGVETRGEHMLAHVVPDYAQALASVWMAGGAVVKVTFTASTSIRGAQVYPLRLPGTA